MIAHLGKRCFNFVKEFSPNNIIMVVSFIATHQARLRGFLQELINTQSTNTWHISGEPKELMDFKTDPPEAINTDEIGKRQQCRNYNLLNLADWIIKNEPPVETDSPVENESPVETDITSIKTKFFDDKGEIASFMNCAILKIHMNGSYVTIELVYQGELDEDKGKKRRYFVTQSDNTQSDNTQSDNTQSDNTQSDNIVKVVFEKITLPLENTILSHFINKENYTFYLMRHGQGDHNVRTGFWKKATAVVGIGNTTLTQTGINQAINAADFAANELNLDPTTINYLFTSDLKRTRQTLAYFYMQLCINKKLINNTNKTFYILPCSHELSYVKSNESITNIDKLNDGLLIASENKPACQFNDIIIQEGNNKFTFTSNASYYRDFYDSNCRFGTFRKIRFGRKGGKKKTRKARVSHKTTYKRKGKKSNSHRRRRRRNTKKRIR
jgi:phosphohistidine phosphatase SixA